ncbi:monofunctional biosynthetic peptidoglycan transglycosylase [Ketogulonicigenium robustum]|uniref:Biosynthetic peptidoglycan transglycosylase n=2 Tax=Ketogulonicigenium robustum TaxID=92947 RepID=A0A1W6P0I0_9RHOB|nr:monofunctional biosynthetic peptidoglycan transglycosylase [Ketogulonicigenium robustum]
MVDEPDAPPPHDTNDAPRPARRRSRTAAPAEGGSEKVAPVKKASAKKASPRKSGARKASKAPPRAGTWALRAAKAIGLAAAGLVVVFVALTMIFAVVRPPTTPYMLAESVRQGGVRHTWVPMDRIAPAMALSAVAAEDANFCRHWGLDLDAIRTAIDSRLGGASTISQQVVKNVFLWHGRNWARKSLEAVMTPVVELFWSKRRILEVYLNVAEFDTGVFGVEAAAQHYFGRSAADLTNRQAALLAAILPNPKERSPVDPSAFVNRRANAIADGAATIRGTARASCFM